ncbi:hypothetical protein C943_02791 [Mariniradius saccharolyticus AK6]|uniref:Uncharacterized protein n=1 Tax=Mariniradius saccharolyticus AK6 TaxID=1239962 RepID=M7X7G7_9BACT|nr:hypothetical protein C943_02791 [Mariniradius saccharolyticus AK6]
MVMHQFTSCSVSFQFQIFRAFFLNFQEFFFEFFKKNQRWKSAVKNKPRYPPDLFS